MERAVWVFASILALSLAIGISSLSSAESAEVLPKNNYNFEVGTCKSESSCSQLGAPALKLSEKFLRKARKARRAFV